MNGSSVVQPGAGGRLAPLSGAAFVVLVLVALVGLGGNTPGGSDPATKVQSFYEAHQGRQVAAAFVLSAAVPLLIIFGVTLARAFPATGPGGRLWPVVLAAGSGLAGAAFLTAALLHFSLADIAGHTGVMSGALQALNELDASTWVAFNAGLGVMMLGAAGTLIPRGRAFRILGWTALVVGLALFVPFADFVALLAAALWIIAASIALSRTSTAT